MATTTKREEKPSQDLIQVWERRMINPGPSGETAIHLKDKSFEVRWMNTQVEGRFHTATREEGWVPVRPSELADNPEDLGLQTDGDRVVRGERGKEILMKIPKSVFEKIRRRKAELTTQALKGTKQRIAEAAASQFGSNAADFVMGEDRAAGNAISGLKGSIVDSLPGAGVELDEE